MAQQQCQGQQWVRTITTAKSSTATASRGQRHESTNDREFTPTMTYPTQQQWLGGQRCQGNSTPAQGIVTWEAPATQTTSGWEPSTIGQRQRAGGKLRRRGRPQPVEHDYWPTTMSRRETMMTWATISSQTRRLANDCESMSNPAQPRQY